MSMKLYYFETMNGRKVCALARHLGSPVEFVRVDLSRMEQRAPAFAAVNANLKIPALEDGATKLFESSAIMAYLAHKSGSDMWPSDPLLQIEALKWISWDIAHFSRHAGVLYWNHCIKPNFGLGEADEREVKEATAFFHRFAKVLDDHLKGRTWVVGDTMSIVDFQLGAVIAEASGAKIPVEGYGEIVRWHEQLNALPSWREPFPERRAAA